MTDYRINNCLLNPGVWLLTISNASSMPVFCNVPNLFYYGDINDAIKAITVLPGFNVIFYDNVNYDGISYIIDNTKGTEIIFSKFPSTIGLSSIRVFFQNTELTDNLLTISTPLTTLTF